MLPGVEALPDNIRRLLDFFWQLLLRFNNNQGMLLASALAFHMLLAILPFSLLIIIGLSHLMPVEQLTGYLHDVMSGFGDAAAGFVVEQTRTAYMKREALGITSMIGLLIFFVAAFRSVRSALNAMFSALPGFNEPVLWLSILLPYLYAVVLALGIVVVTLFAGLLDATVPEQWSLFGYTMKMAVFGELVLQFSVVIIELVIFALVYKVFPHVKIKWKHAMIGAAVATLLWEIARRIVVWFSSTLSVASLLYGSFAAIVTILLALHAAAVILLLGAQTISVYNELKSAATGVSERV